MASRMDRYKEDESRITGRSDRNKSLYKQIEDLDSYTNIAGVATIDNKNSIDLEKVKELLRHSEKKEEIILDEEIIEEKELEETRKYDIKDLLSKAKDNDNEVILLERNQEPGKKILVTGNGRCNYYNEDQNLNHYNSSNTNLIDKIITEENKKEILNFFNKIGIIPKIKNGYYYPYSNQATSIKNALINEAKRKQVNIITNTYVENILKENNKYKVITNNETYIVDSLIIATGSSSAPKTGSDGNGYNLIKKLNHTVI
jgi:hypothetical protein